MEFYYGNISAQLDHLRRSLEWIYPELSLGLLIPILLMAAILLPKNLHRNGLPFLLAAGILFSAYLVNDQEGYILGSLQHAWFLNLIRVDTLSVHFRLLGLLASFIVVGIALISRPAQGWKTEFWVFLATAIVGMNLLCLSTHWLMVYLSIETLSLSSYLMTGYLRKEGATAEAGLKYFIFGSVATAAFLYGVSLLYGLTGTLDFSSIEFSSNLLKQESTLPATIAMLMMWGGIAFKLSAFPMHFWSPDVYEGSPTAVATFLSTAPKVAAIALVIRIIPAFPEGSLSIGFEYILGITAILSLFAGNTGALRQNNLQRLLAWSGIAHTGYLLATLACSTPESIEAIQFYLFVYILANTGAFASIALIKQYWGEADLRLLNGKGFILGIPAALLILFLATLGGLPPTSGFLAKIKIILPIFETYTSSQHLLYLFLLIAVVLNTVIGLYYYVRPLAVLYFGGKEQGLVSVKFVWWGLLLVMVLAAGVMLAWAG